MKKKQKLLIYFAAFLIPVIVALIGLIAGGFAPFGTKDVLTSGGMEGYIPYYNELYDRVRNGTFFAYNSSNGMGYDFTTIFTYYLSDPINLIVLIFPKTSMLSILNILYMLKLGLAGLLFSVFLCYRYEKESKKPVIAKKYAKKTNPNKTKKDVKIGGSEELSLKLAAIFSSPVFSIIAFSVCYALSGYMLGQGLNITSLTSVCLLPVIIMGIDKLIAESNWRLYTVSLIISFFSSFHMTLVISVFVLLYFFLQNYKSGNHFIKSLMFKLFGDILAVGASSVIIINCLKSEAITDNMSSDFSLCSVITTIFDVIKMQTTGVASSALSTSSNGIDIYAGALSIFLIFIYILNKNISLKEKLKNLLLLLIVFTATFVSTLNYIFNALLISEHNVSVFGFVFVFTILLIGFNAFINLDYSTTANVISSLAASILLIAASIIWSNDYESMSPFLKTIEFIFVYFIITLLWKNDSMTKWLTKTLLAVVLIAEVSTSFVQNASLLGKSTNNYTNSDTYKYEATKNYILSKEPNAKILTHEYKTTDHTPATDALLGYKYIICKEGTTDISYEYTKVDSFMGIEIYENPYCSSGAFFTDSDILTWSYNSAHPLKSTNLLYSDVLKTEEPFTISTGRLETTDAFVISESNPNEFEENAFVFTFTPDIAGDFYGCVVNTIHFGNVTLGNTIMQTHIFKSSELTSSQFEFEFGVFNAANFKQLLDKVDFADATNENNLSKFSINAKNDGYLFINKNYSSNWNCLVNGTTVFPVSISDTYLAIPVKAGTNNIELSYYPSYYMAGWVISIFFLILLVVLSIKATVKFRERTYSFISSGKRARKLAGFMCDNYVYFATFGIGFLVYLFSMMATGSIPFGQGTSVVSDGYLQSLPFFYYLNGSIKNWSLSIFNSNIGIITNEYTSIQTSLASPLYDLMLLCPSSVRNEAFALSACIHFALTGIAIIFYLTHRPNQKSIDKSNPLLIVLGLCYSLCSYTTNYYSFGFTYTALLLPFILLAMENLIYNKKSVPYIIVLAYAMILTNYTCFLMCEFMFLYFFVLDHKNFKEFIMNGIRFGISSIVSALLSAYALLPFYASTRQSTYLGKDAVSPTINLSNSILANIKDYMVCTEGYTVTDNNSAANTYCGIFILLLALLFVLVKDIKLSVRIRKFLLAAFLFFAYGNELLNYILHGFHFQSKVPNRFAIFWIFLIITFAYDVLLNLKEINKKLMIILASIGTILLIAAWSYNNDFSSLSFSYIASIFFTVVYLALIIVFALKKKEGIIRRLALPLLLVEMLISSTFIMYNNMGVDVGYSLADNDNIDELMASVSDPSDELAITEFINSNQFNIGYMTDTKSLSIFSSSFNKYQRDLISRWGIASSTNCDYYSTGNPVGDMMLHVKYHLTDVYDDDSVSIYDVTKISDNIELHENPYYLSAGVYMNSSLVDFSEESLDNYNNILEYQNAFAHKFGVSDIYSFITLETEESKLDKKHSFCYADLNSLGEDGTGVLNIKLYISEDVEGDLYIPVNGFALYLGSTELGEQSIIDVDYDVTEENKNYEIKVAVLNKDALNELHDILSRHQLKNITFDGKTVAGSIDCPNDGYVYLSIPNYPSAKVYVDGNEVNAISLLSGIGVPVTSGNHTIKVEYHVPMLGLGILISVIAVILLIAYVIITKRINSKKASEVEASEE